jgi:hypothetical protein
LRTAHAVAEAHAPALRTSWPSGALDLRSSPSLSASNRRAKLKTSQTVFFRIVKQSIRSRLTSGTGATGTRVAHRWARAFLGLFNKVVWVGLETRLGL